MSFKYCVTSGYDELLLGVEVRLNNNMPSAVAILSYFLEIHHGGVPNNVKFFLIEANLSIACLTHKI